MLIEHWNASNHLAWRAQPIANCCDYEIAFAVVTPHQSQFGSNIRLRPIQLSNQTVLIKTVLNVGKRIFAICTLTAKISD